MQLKKILAVLFGSATFLAADAQKPQTPVKTATKITATTKFIAEQKKDSRDEFIAQGYRVLGDYTGPAPSYDVSPDMGDTVHIMRTAYRLKSADGKERLGFYDVYVGNTMFGPCYSIDLTVLEKSAKEYQGFTGKAKVIYRIGNFYEIKNEDATTRAALDALKKKTLAARTAQLKVQIIK